MDRSFIWRRGDWGGHFGLPANNLTNLLAMIGLLLFVVGSFLGETIRKTIPRTVLLPCLAGLGLLLLAMNPMLQPCACCMIAGVFVLKHDRNLREAGRSLQAGSGAA